MSTTAVKERPILCRPEMVRAFLEDRKTQTRRMVKHQIPEDAWEVFAWFGGEEGKRWMARGWAIAEEGLYCITPRGLSFLGRCPYGKPGDQLRVRESVGYTTDRAGQTVLVYQADGAARYVLAEDEGEGDLCGLGGKCSNHHPVERWRPSIHMPRWASRVTLEVVSIRVERVRSISKADAIAEGFKSRENFFDLFFSINKRAPADSDPFVWVVEVERVLTSAQPVKMCTT